MQAEDHNERAAASEWSKKVRVGSERYPGNTCWWGVRSRDALCVYNATRDVKEKERANGKGEGDEQSAAETISESRDRA